MSPFPWSQALANAGATALVTCALMLAAWAVGVFLRDGRHDGVDVVWGLGFVLVALTTLALSGDYGDGWRQGVVTTLTTLWGLRLAGHIFRRNRGRPEDRRYRHLLANPSGNPAAYALRKVYLPQGLVLWLVSWPVQLAQYGRGDTLTGTELATALGVLAWLVGFIFETEADSQLAEFTADPSHHDQVLDQGLWRYTRHPNYFGDACVWWGLALLALHHPPGLLALPSAAVMTYLLVKATGARLLESTIGDRRPGYADYIARTSGFIPRPPRRPTNDAQQ